MLAREGAIAIGYCSRLYIKSIHIYKALYTNTDWFKAAYRDNDSKMQKRVNFGCMAALKGNVSLLS